MASTGEAASSVLALELELISAPAAAQMERRRRAETKAFREGMANELVIDDDEMCLTPTDYLFCWLTTWAYKLLPSTMAAVFELLAKAVGRDVLADTSRIPKS